MNRGLGRGVLRRSACLATAIILLTSALGCGDQPRTPGALRLEESLIIGLDPAVPLGQVLDIAVDSRGVIYILDAGFDVIRKFGADGSDLGVVSREGEGPGEIYTPLCIAVGPEDRLYIGGTGRRVAVLESDGQPASFSIERKSTIPLISLAVDGQGNVFTSDLDVFEQTVIHRYDAETHKHALSFGKSYAVGRDIDTRVEQKHAGGHLDVGPEGRIYYAQRTPQIIQVFSPSGVLLETHQARFAESGEPPGVEVRDGVPVLRMPVQSMAMVVLGSGSYLTSLFFPPLDDQDEYRHLIDLYDRSGKLVASRTETAPFWVKCKDSQGAVYVAEERDDIPVVVRYRIDLPG